jgi:hypothetical protein
MNRLDLIQCFLSPGRKGLEFILKITNVILSCKTASLRLSETIYFVNQEVLAFARMTISCNKQEIPARWLESYCQHQCIVMAGSTRNLHQLARCLVMADLTRHDKNISSQTSDLIVSTQSQLCVSARNKI